MMISSQTTCFAPTQSCNFYSYQTLIYHIFFTHQKVLCSKEVCSHWWILHKLFAGLLNFFCYFVTVSQQSLIFCYTSWQRQLLGTILNSWNINYGSQSITPNNSDSTTISNKKQFNPKKTITDINGMYRSKILPDWTAIVHSVGPDPAVATRFPESVEYSMLQSKMSHSGVSIYFTWWFIPAPLNVKVMHET